jgi:propionyl-CoA carboxylase alpha chain
MSTHKLCICNRGEIALRILKSAVALDIPTFAVYTEPDARAPHVLRATEAVLIPNYLDQCVSPPPSAIPPEVADRTLTAEMRLLRSVVRAESRSFTLDTVC